MPRKNVRKIYVKDGIYHIYNRGVEKRVIFLEDNDYKYFLKLLKDSLSIPSQPPKINFTVTFKGQTFKGVPRQPKNFTDKIILLAYCLMPNHFHLLIKQTNDTTIKKFMQSVSTRYSMYFNKKYDRVGSLFQSAYRAILVQEERYLLHLSRYIHQNPSELGQKLKDSYSSYADYLNLRNTNWINKTIILSNFNNKKVNSLNIPSHINSYQSFVEDSEVVSEDMLGNIILDDLD